MSNRISEYIYMPERMSDRVSIYIIYIYIYTYAINTSRWYVRNYVIIVCKRGDYSKKVLYIYICLNDSPWMSHDPNTPCMDFYCTFLDRFIDQNVHPKRKHV